jgi:hypothetical protein
VVRRKMKDNDAQSVIENYLFEVRRNLPDQIAREVVPELRSHLIEEATAGGDLSVEGARSAVGRMGNPQVIADEYLKEYNAPRRSDASKEQAAYSRVAEPRHGRVYADRWSERHHHHTHYYRTPSHQYWLLFAAVVVLVGPIISFLRDPSTPPYLFGGVSGFVTLTLIYYVLRAQSLQTLRLVEGTLKTLEGQRFSVDGLSSELEIRPRDLRMALIDLRGEGRIKFSFDHLTGDIIVGEAAKELPRSVVRNYCSYCDAALPSRAQFCPNCGAWISQSPSAHGE